MPDATVRGSYELSVEQPLRGLRSIRDAGAEADIAIRRLGERMDSVGGASRGLTTWREQLKRTGGEVRDLQIRLTELEAKIDRFGTKSSTAKIELRGMTEANLALSELEARLDRLDRRRVSPNVGMSGALASNVAGGGRGGRGGGLFSSLGGIPGMLPWWAIPAAAWGPGLLGGAAGLVGSAGAGLLGVGSIGLGALGAGAVGAGGAAATIIPAVKGLQELTKAQEAYTKAVQEFGQTSTQAATAKLKLNAALVMNPDAAPAIRQLTALRQAWGDVTQPGRQTFYQGVAGVAANVRGAAPVLGGISNVATGAVSSAAVDYSRFLTSGPMLNAMTMLATSFAHELPVAERSLENLTRLFAHLAVAASPFFREANRAFEQWTKHLADTSANIYGVRNRMHEMVNSAKDWGRMLENAGRLLRDIFSAGRPTGDTMIESFGRTLDRWDRFIRSHPEQVTGFFDRAQRTVEQIARIFQSVVSTVTHLSQLITPVASRLVDIAGLVAGLGPVGGSLLTGGVYGAYRGLRGAGYNAPNPLSVAGAYVLGSPGVAARGAAAGPTAAGAEGGLLGRIAAAESGLGRITGALGEMAVGAARVVMPLMGISAALAAMQPTPGGGVWGHLQNVSSALTLGLLPGYQQFGAKQQGRAQTFLQGVEGLPSDQQLAAINAQLTRTPRMLSEPGSLSWDIFGFGTPGRRGVNPAQTTLRAAQIQTQAQLTTTPEQLQNLQAQVGWVRANVELRLPRIQQAAFERSVQQAVTDATRTVAGKAAFDWEAAFTTAITRDPRHINRAIDTMLSGIPSQLHALGRQGSLVMSRAIAQWAQQMAEDDPKLRGPMRKLMSGITDDLTKIFGTARDRIIAFNGDIFTNARDTWQSIGKAMTDPASVAQERLHGIWTAVQQDAIDALTKMGWSKASARTVVTQVAGGTLSVGAAETMGPGHPLVAGIATGIAPPTSAGLLGAQQPRRQRGGMIPGSGLLDSVRTPDGGWAAPGEAWIANRHTMQMLDLAALRMFGKTAWQMISSEPREHAAPLRYATGGLLGAQEATARGATTMGGLHAGIATIMAQVLARWPNLAVTSTLRSGSGSYHNVGEAVDLASSDYGYMRAAADWINSTGMWHQLTEGIHNPNLSVKNGQQVSPSFWGASTWAGHANHIHLAVAGVLGALGAAHAGGAGLAAFPQINLRAPASGLRGIPGLIADTAGGIYAAGLSGALNAHLGASGGGGPLVGGTYMAIARAAAAAAGVPFDQRIMSMLFTKESGGRNLPASGPLSATGPMQIIPSTFASYALSGHTDINNPTDSMYAAFRYIAARYGTLQHLADVTGLFGAGYKGYSRGGRAKWAGWHAGGVDAVVDSPVVFGAGERGRERVRIGPPGGHVKAGPSIVVNVNVEHMGGQRSDAERLAEVVAERLLAALARVDQGVPDAQLMGAR